MKKNIAYVGLDVHKDSISVAIAEGGRKGEVGFYGTIGGDINSFAGLLKKLSAEPGRQLQFVYEAGPCGYEIYRFLKSKGHECAVVSPAHIPRSATDRIKTDRRDACTLARLHRAGELTYVYVPREEDEAMRDLVRAREDAVKAQRVARQQLKAMLLRLGIRYAGKSSWGPKHFRWLSDQKMPSPVQQVVFEEYIRAIHETTARVEGFNQQLATFSGSWRMFPVVQGLQALRGVSLVVAVTTVAELGDLNRFDHPSQLMSFLGLVPSESSSGPRKQQGGITKSGNRHVRKVLAEAAQAYCYPARVSRRLLKRQEGVSQELLDIAWKCQLRLCARFRRMMARGKNRNKVIIATARELCAFMWAIARRVSVPA
jgi:transposase